MDAVAFRAFYGATVRPLVRHLKKLGVDRPEDLEDVMQEAYAQAFRGIDAVRAEEARVAWLFTIARRQWGRTLERRKKLTPIGEDADDPAPPDDGRPSAEDALDRQGTFGRMKEMIAQIGDPKQREAVELFYLYDWDLAEVSAELGVNPSTVTTWLARFRTRARGALAAPKPRRLVSLSWLRGTR